MLNNSLRTRLDFLDMSGDQIFKWRNNRCRGAPHETAKETNQVHRGDYNVSKHVLPVRIPFLVRSGIHRSIDVAGTNLCFLERI
mmetsp:Transcript_29120/g.113108  ORF Transcript_29120/g.113108 Transcript_29120/m.113108 type:complete len:84 (+) Transcript_29120:624-875(+)